jgi:hypothetical protein
MPLSLQVSLILGNIRTNVIPRRGPVSGYWIFKPKPASGLRG